MNNYVISGIGFVMMIVSAIFIWYYGMVIGWVYFYLIQSFYPTLGWSTCNNSWNTPNCRGMNNYFHHFVNVYVAITHNLLAVQITAFYGIRRGRVVSVGDLKPDVMVECPLARHIS